MSRLFWYCHICRLLNVSYLYQITNPPHLTNATLPIRATKRNPNYQGSRVYFTDRGSHTQALLLGLLHVTLTIGAVACNPNGQGSQARPGRGRRYAQALPSQLELRTQGFDFALAVCATCSQQLNGFIYYN